MDLSFFHNAKRTAWLAFVIVLLACVVYWLNFLRTPLVTGPNGYHYTVKYGASFRSIANDLHAQQILTHPFCFNLLVLLRHDAKHLKAGEYYLPPDTTPTSLITQFVKGQGLILHAFRIIPGETFAQVRAALSQNPYVVHKIGVWSDSTVMKKMHAAGFNPEGLLYADTYYFSMGTSDLSLLKRAYKAMDEKLTHAWLLRDPSVPFVNAYQALVAASLVEKEAFFAEERPLIASVLINRLKKNMLLQFDPTVIYGLGSRYKGAIYKTDLLDKTNHYNTYVLRGLPPTPIAMPSYDSINAVLHPARDAYLYFVATGQKGRHHFSVNLNEHNLAVIQARHYRAVSNNLGLYKKYIIEKVLAERALMQ